MNVKTTDFKRNLLGRMRIYKYPPPRINALVSALGDDDGDDDDHIVVTMMVMMIMVKSNSLQKYLETQRLK